MVDGLERAAQALEVEVAAKPQVEGAGQRDRVVLEAMDVQLLLVRRRVLVCRMLTRIEGCEHLARGCRGRERALDQAGLLCQRGRVVDRLGGEHDAELALELRSD